MTRGALVLVLLAACGGDDGHSCSTCLADSAASADGAASDALQPTDGPVASGCPVSFVAIAGGQGTHRYRLINATDDWGEQRGTCAGLSSSAYLAIPDDAAELAAIATLSAASASWVGLGDMVTENTFVTVKGTPATYLPWDNNQPDDNGGGGGEDCVIIQTSTGKLRDEKCSSKFRAVCECEP